MDSLYSFHVSLYFEWTSLNFTGNILPLNPGIYVFAYFLLSPQAPTSKNNSEYLFLDSLRNEMCIFQIYKQEDSQCESETSVDNIIYRR